ncbi:MAG: sodium:calcium antiporter [Calothrix sp. MO_192.B10]|nr:sodium:calcium antiporter [Calothrix sp. MO_192.B10]
MLLFIQVIICLGLVIVVGSQLSQSADVLAEKTGLGRTWVGATLLAGATSLPELATGISAVTAINAPDLAAGGIFGSCLFNLLILGLLDIFSGREPLLKRAQVSHGLAASLGCVMLGIASVGMLLGNTNNDANTTVGWVGFPSILLICLYAISAFMIAQFEMRRRAEVLEEEAEVFHYEHISPKQAYLKFAVLAIAIVVIGVWLAFLGEEVAVQTGIGESFVGALLLAAATSLPEVVSSLAAIKLDAVDLAVSNVFGSNLFNLAILGTYDFFYVQGNLLTQVSQIHIFTSVLAMVMTSVAITGLIYNAARRTKLYITWDGITLIVLYIGAMYVIYRS